jgi:hypothetical protein
LGDNGFIGLRFLPVWFWRKFFLRIVLFNRERGITFISGIIFLPAGSRNQEDTEP